MRSSSDTETARLAELSERDEEEGNATGAALVEMGSLVPWAVFWR